MLAVMDSGLLLWPPRWKGFAEHVEEPLRDEFGAGVERGAFDEDHELVAAEAPDGVAVPQDGREARGHRAQEFVAGLVAKGVVGVLEAVEVYEERGCGNAVAAGAGQHVVDPIEDQRTVGQAGQRVVQRLVADLVEQAGIADRGCGLPGEAPEAINDLGVAPQPLGVLGDHRDDLADELTIGDDRHSYPRDRRGLGRQRADQCIFGSRVVELDVFGNRGRGRIENQATQSHLVVGRIPGTRPPHDPSPCRDRTARQGPGRNRSPWDGPRELGGDVVDTHDLREGSRQLEEDARRRRLPPGLFHRGRRIERGRRQPCVCLQRDPFLWEEARTVRVVVTITGIECGQTSIVTARRCHVDDQTVPFRVLTVSENGVQHLRRLALVEAYRIDPLRDIRQRFQHQRIRGCAHRARRRRDDTRKHPFDTVRGNDLRDGALQCLEASFQYTRACRNSQPDASRHPSLPN